MSKFVLYSGEHCCLCDDAKSLLAQTSINVSQLVEIDVKSDPKIFHLYGARIPVLVNTNMQQELAWPFELQQLIEFLS
jgi:hypothetical protein